MLFGARCKFQGTSFQLPPRAAVESLFCRRFQRAVRGFGGGDDAGGRG